jgi:ABC-type glycerol-3-phosphate transport system substrate-binding protein
MDDRLFTERMSRRRFVRAAAVLAGTTAFGGTLAACGAPSGSSSRITVNAWDWWVSQSPWLDNEVKLFAQAHGGIQLKRTVNATSTYDRLFTLAERSGTAPDVFMVSTTTVPLNQQVANGWLLPLDQWANSSWRRRFPAYSFVEGSNMFGGKVYSAPLTAPAPWLQLYINNKVFRAAGLTNADGSVRIPRTWDDVTRFAETITKKGNGDVYGLGFGNGSFPILPWWVEVFVRPAGSHGGATGPDGRTGKYTFGSDRNYLDFAQLLLEWNRRGYVFPSSISISDEIARSYFERGRFGMTIGGVWNQAEWTQHGFKDYSLTTLIGPLQQRKGYFYSSPGIGTGTQPALAISSKTRHPDQAWAWFDWFYGKDAGRRWVQEYHEDLSIYPRNNDPGKIGFKPFAQYVGLKDLAIPGPSASLRNPAQAYVVINPVQPDFGTILTGLYTGQVKDVRSAFSDLDARLENALDAGIKQAQQQGHSVSRNDLVFADWDITRPYKWNIPEYP